MFETMALEIEQLLTKVRNSVMHTMYTVSGIYLASLNPAHITATANDFLLGVVLF
jgi:hypothetical protein